MLAHLFNDVVSIALLLVPAYLVMALLRGRDDAPTRLEAVSETLLLAVTLVSIPVFTVAMLTRSFLDATWMTAGALIIAAAAGAALFLRHRSDWKTVLKRRRAVQPGDRAALILSLVVFVFFLVNYDRRHFQYGCINGVVMQALTAEAAGAFDPHGNEDEDAVDSEDWGAPTARDADATMDLLDVHGTGQRLGTTAVIAPMVALFDVLGFRLIYALLPALCLLFGFRLIRRVTRSPEGTSSRSPVPALAAATFGVVNPYVAKIVILDENVMAFCLLTPALALLVERRHWALAGLAFGAALGIRHIALPFGFTALVLMGRDWRAVLRFGLTGLLFALPCAFHHHFTYGSVFQHEHFVDEIFVSVPHQLGPWTFDYTGLLNYPFYERWVRTPYNPYPTAFYYPLNTVAHFGTLLVAAALIGATRLVRRHRRLVLALLCWMVPQYALLAVLENWMDPNKMGIIIGLFTPLVLALGVGFDWVRSWPRAGIWAGAAAALSAATIAAGSWTLPDDPRFYEKYPRVRAERAEYYDFERDSVTTGSPLPSLYFFQQYTLFRPVDRLRHLAQDYVDRGFRRPAPPIADSEAAPVWITLDLSRPFIGRTDFATFHTEGPNIPEEAVDATHAKAQIQLDGLTGWEPTRPLSALVARNATHELDIYLRFGEDGFADVSSDRVYSIEQRQRPHLVRRQMQGNQVHIAVRPTDRVRILETVALDEVLVYVWELDPTTQTITTPRKMFHN